MTELIMWTLNVFTLGFICGAATMALACGSMAIWYQVRKEKRRE